MGCVDICTRFMHLSVSTRKITCIVPAVLTWINAVHMAIPVLPPKNNPALSITQIITLALNVDIILTYFDSLKNKLVLIAKG